MNVTAFSTPPAYQYRQAVRQRCGSTTPAPRLTSRKHTQPHSTARWLINTQLITSCLLMITKQAQQEASLNYADCL